MDKLEINMRAKEIEALAKSGDFDSAKRLADTVDWRRVGNIRHLTIVSDIYKYKKEYKTALSILQLALDIAPTGRTIIAGLCDLAIKSDNFALAVEYYKQFENLYPEDAGKYILQYKLCKMRNIPLEDRVLPLEAYKQKDQSAHWFYELAEIYFHLKLYEKCVETCEEILLFFDEKTYVIKSLELLRLNRQLTEDEEDLYNYAKGITTFRKRPQYSDDELSDDQDENEALYEDEPRKNAGTFVPFSSSKSRAPVATGEIRGDSEDVFFDGEKPHENAETHTFQVHLSDETLTMQNELANNVAQFFNDDPMSDMNADIELDSDSELEPESDSDTGYAYDEDDELSAYDQAYNEIEIYDDEEEVYITEVKDLEDKKEKKDKEQELLEESEEVYWEGDNFEADGRTRRFSRPVKGLEFSNVVAEEINGQMSLISPTLRPPATQVSGQISLEAISPAERVKEETVRKIEEEASQKIKTDSGEMFERLKLSALAEIAKAEAESELTTKLSDDENDTNARSELFSSLGFKYHVPVHTKSDKEESPEIPKATSAAEDTDTFKSTSDDEFIKSEEKSIDQDDNQVKDYINNQENNQVNNQINDQIDNQVNNQINNIEDTVLIQKADAALLHEKTQREKESGKPVASNALVSDEKPKAAPGRTGRIKIFNAYEEALIAPFIFDTLPRNQTLEAIVSISKNRGRGNVIVTGGEHVDTMGFSRALLKAVQLRNIGFTGKAGRVSAENINHSDISGIFAKLANGAITIEKAHLLDERAISRITDIMNNQDVSVIIIIEGPKKELEQKILSNKNFASHFGLRIDLSPLDIQDLVEYAKKYANQKEHVIDEFAGLALYSKLELMQTNEHSVTIDEVKKIIDDAISRSSRKNFKHFTDLILSKRFDQNDMVILREKDFL